MISRRLCFAAVFAVTSASTSRALADDDSSEKHPRRFRQTDEAQMVHLTLDADQPGASLQALTAHPGWIAFYGRWHHHVMYGPVLRWQPLCVAPCKIELPANLVYRVAGPSVTASNEFTVGPPQTARALHVRAGSRAMHAGGAVSLALGIPTTIVGIILATASHDSRTAGYVAGGVGVGLIALGAVLLATSTTDVYDEGNRMVASRESK